MRRFIPFLILPFVFSPICFAETIFEKASKGLPKDVASFMEKNAGCLYRGGEVPVKPKVFEDSAEKEIYEHQFQETQTKQKELGCSTLEKEKTTLNKKYKSNRMVLDAIESSSRLHPSDF